MVILTQRQNLIPVILLKWPVSFSHCRRTLTSQRLSEQRSLPLCVHHYLSESLTSRTSAAKHPL